MWGAAMLRLSKLTDYALLVMSAIAKARSGPVLTAREIAGQLQLPLPTVSKLLKQLSQNQLLVSQRGVKGGYSLARDPQMITLSEIISAVEGTVALTDCSTGVAGLCEIERCCAIKRNQQIISQALRSVFEALTLFDLTRPLDAAGLKNIRTRLVPITGAGLQGVM